MLRWSEINHVGYAADGRTAAVARFSRAAGRDLQIPDAVTRRRERPV